jgi:hypothetical protein
MMRGPDSNTFYNTVYLKSASTNDKYYWYRNGVLINVPNTSLDDTTRTLTVYSTSSSTNGAFTLVTKGFDNCPTPPSDPVNLFFNNSAPTISSSNLPTNFAGTALSNKEVQLTWVDKSAIETNYEIWRRKPGDFFRLAGLAPANATSFIDTGLEPSVAYDYKIRVLTETSKSNYVPSNTLTTNLVVTTLGDNTAPTEPTNLAVTGNTVNSISLSWSAATDDTGIRRYVVTYNGSTVATPNAATSYTIQGLPMNTAFSITVQAEDLGGNLSAPSSSVVGATYMTGLIYGHSTGAWTDLDQITVWNSPEYTGTVPNFTLAPRTQEDFFNFEYSGFIYINNAGTYQFRTTSDDGSRLALNDVVILDNDGLHGNVTVTSPNQELGSGPQAINVKYFEYTGGQSLTVEYRGPDTFFFWTTIPNSALKSGAAPPVVGASISNVIVMNETQKADELISVNIFPNPSSQDNIQVKVDTKIDGPVDVKMVDMMGRPYYRNTFTRDQIRAGAKINPNSSLINGMYVLIVNQGTATVKQKILIKN